MSNSKPGTARGSLLVLAGLLVGFALAWLVLAGPLRGTLPGLAADSAAESGDSGSGLWTCGMHPEVLESEPGSCPICHMELVPVQGGGAAGDHAGHNHAGTDPELWTCPMHPNILESEPGSCPICGMDLVPRESDPAEGHDGGEAGNGSASENSLAVRIDPLITQNMNVRTELAQRRDLGRRVRTIGYLEFDPQRMVTVTPRYKGWVESVRVHYLGEQVRRGQPLFEIYSPELVQTEQELLSALRFAERLADAPEDARERAHKLVAAARSRLAYWDVSPEQIAELEHTGAVFRTLTVRAPASGVVMKRLPGLEGMAVEPGMELFHIADLSSLWLSVEAFESQIAWVRPGLEARVEFASFPGEIFRGRVRLLEPEVSEQTRTLKVRLSVPNPDRRLRVGMFASVELTPPATADTLTVPSQAVLRSGERDLVVVRLGDGRFAPRRVTLGREADGYAEILAGLEEGEQIVTSAQFLLDSESNLQAAVQKLIADFHDHERTPAPESREER